MQSRPDHLLLSVDLTAPPVTIVFRSSHTLRGTAFAPIDHAPLRLTMQYRFQMRKQWGKPRQLDEAHREAFHRGDREVGASELGQIEAMAPASAEQRHDGFDH